MADSSRTLAVGIPLVLEDGRDRPRVCSRPWFAGLSSSVATASRAVPGGVLMLNDSRGMGGGSDLGDRTNSELGECADEGRAVDSVLRETARSLMRSTSIDTVGPACCELPRTGSGIISKLPDLAVAGIAGTPAVGIPLVFSLLDDESVIPRDCCSDESGVSSNGIFVL